MTSCTGGDRTIEVPCNASRAAGVRVVALRTVCRSMVIFVTVTQSDEAIGRTTKVVEPDLSRSAIDWRSPSTGKEEGCLKAQNAKTFRHEKTEITFSNTQRKEGAGNGESSLTVTRRRWSC